MSDPQRRAIDQRKRRRHRRFTLARRAAQMGADPATQLWQSLRKRHQLFKLQLGVMLCPVGVIAVLFPLAVIQTRRL